MGIKSYIDMSLIDWDGKVSSVVFIGGCNLRCPFCHNWDLATNPSELEDLDTDAVMEKIRSSSSWIDGVVITGGEPTCYSGLADLAEEIRSMGLKVKLDTNGTRPDVIRKLLDQNLFDHISLDVKNSFGKYSETAGAEVNTDDIMESIRLIMEFDDYEMRTTVVPGLVCPEDLEEICSYIKGSDIYVLQRFHPENIKDKRFSALPPQNDDEMEHLRSLCSRHVRTVWRN